MLLLSNREVERLLAMPECIAVLEEAYRALAKGEAACGQRADIATPTALPEAVYQLKSMSAVAPALGVGAIRLNSDIIAWPVEGGRRRRTKLPCAPGARYTGLVLLFSTASGEPLAIFPDGVVQRMRVGATSGLGAKYLAREDAREVGLIGAGWQAGAQAMAIVAVRSIERIRCFAPTRARLVAFCEEMRRVTGIAVEPVDTPEAAVRGADIVLCATNSTEAVFHGEWFAPGMHVSTIRGPELDPATVGAADVAIVHDANEQRGAEGHVVTTHGIVLPEMKKRAEQRDAGALPAIEHAPMLADLIAGKVAGRIRADQRTVFLNFHGIGLQFAACGAAIYRKALDEGLGKALPTDWFTEDLVP